MFRLVIGQWNNIMPEERKELTWEEKRELRRQKRLKASQNINRYVTKSVHF